MSEQSRLSLNSTNVGNGQAIARADERGRATGAPRTGSGQRSPRTPLPAGVLRTSVGPACMRSRTADGGAKNPTRPTTHREEIAVVLSVSCFRRFNLKGRKRLKRRRTTCICELFRAIVAHYRQLMASGHTTHRRRPAATARSAFPRRTDRGGEVRLSGGRREHRGEPRHDCPGRARASRNRDTAGVTRSTSRSRTHRPSSRGWSRTWVDCSSGAQLERR